MRSQKQVLAAVLALAGVFLFFADADGGLFRRRTGNCCAPCGPTTAPSSPMPAVKGSFGATVKGIAYNADNSPITDVNVNVVITDSLGNPISGTCTYTITTGQYSVTVTGALQSDNLIKVSFNRVGNPKVDTIANTVTTTVGGLNGLQNQTLNVIVPK